ncbi:hypothetical protein [Kribbella sp. NPDC003557]|uniref:hypothetical protein n=1 Tax=Kribbella sp. NPDC003557 TaxID=3154449 RepID=UPI0033B1FA4F
MVRRILVLVVLLFALGATPAHAGGPTSVLLSAPPSVVAVGYEDQQYSDLQQLIQTTTQHDVGSEAHSVGRFVRATWLIHDMSVWRIDVIYPDAPGGPWIATEEFMGGTKPAKPTWHRPADPVRLLQVLGSLELLEGESIGGPTLDDGYTAEQATPEPAQTQPAQAEAAGSSPTFFTGWRWIIPGVLLGAAVAVVAARLFPKRRWELID